MYSISYIANHFISSGHPGEIVYKEKQKRYSVPLITKGTIYGHNN